jgi:hypothetical protein
MSVLSQIGLAVWLQIIMCAISLIHAARFAWSGGLRRLRVTGALAAATLFATLASVAMGLAMVGRSSAQLAAARSPRLVANLLAGAGEAMAGGLMGFATLTLVAILIAVGIARAQAPS